MTDQKIVEVITAHLNGKTVQSRRDGSEGWYDCKSPSWDFGQYE